MHDRRDNFAEDPDGKVWVSPSTVFPLGWTEADLSYVAACPSDGAGGAAGAGNP